MGYTVTTYKYDTGQPGSRPAYRGVVREYTDSPVVIVHQCELVHYDRTKAIKDAEKLKVNMQVCKVL